MPRFSLDSFSDLRSELFKVAYQGGGAKLRLAEVNDLIGKAGKGESFSLLFRGSANPPLKQGTYRFTHPNLGAFLLFLVPVGQPLPDGSAHYEAVFNRQQRRL